MNAQMRTEIDLNESEIDLNEYVIALNKYVNTFGPLHMWLCNRPDIHYFEWKLKKWKTDSISWNSYSMDQLYVCGGWAEIKILNACSSMTFLKSGHVA